MKYKIYEQQDGKIRNAHEINGIKKTKEFVKKLPDLWGKSWIVHTTRNPYNFVSAIDFLKSGLPKS